LEALKIKAHNKNESSLCLIVLIYIISKTFYRFKSI
jgi:hypothetical protein